MHRPGEITYFANIGEKGRCHSVNKPFSDERCGALLMEVGAVMALLPEPPAKVLECGCGTGWLTYFLSKRGYDATGVDISDDAVDLAKKNPMFAACPAPAFLRRDFDDLGFDCEFDAVVFFAALQHTLDEAATLKSVYAALRPGGKCIASEPGFGHAKRSRRTMEQHDVTDRDMPPGLVIRRGREVGFRKFQIHQHADQIYSVLYSRPSSPLRKALFRLWGIKYLALLFSMLFYKRFNGIVVMIK